MRVVRNRFIAVLLFVTLITLFGCVPRQTFRACADRRGLSFGVAVQAADVVDPKSIRLLTGNFNEIVPENTMKWGVIRPLKDFWNWSDMDAMVAFAEKNHIRMKGHAFLWHQQNPPYINALKTREEAIALMTEQITTVMTRYKGRIVEYDIANEVLADDGSWRDTIWYRTIGPDYLDIAFLSARAADPGAKLILNDYSNEAMGQPKADAFFELVKAMKERGVPIDGVGFQMHLDAQYPVNEEAIRANIRRFGELGIAVTFSEIDVRVKMPVTPERESLQIAVYTKLMDIALSEPNAKSFIMWGYTDLRSWIPQFFPGYGSGHLFDRQINPKPAYFALKSMLEEKARQ
jgi:endo-1,4-beta-xylanase